MIDYFTIIEKFSEIISTEDIKKILNIEDGVTVDIFGNYDTFIFNKHNTTNGYFGKIVQIAKLCKDSNVDLNCVIVCKKGWLKYFKDWIKYFFTYFKKRNDLNLYYRTKLSIIKTNRWVGNVKYAVDIFEYIKNENIHNMHIKTLFNKNEIKTVHIYNSKSDKDFILKYKFDAKYKR